LFPRLAVHLFYLPLAAGLTGLCAKAPIGLNKMTAPNGSTWL